MYVHVSRFYGFLDLFMHDLLALSNLLDVVGSKLNPETGHSEGRNSLNLNQILATKQSNQTLKIKSGNRLFLGGKSYPEKYPRVVVLLL